MHDPIVMEIVKSAFATISAEMSVTVVRGSYSTSIKEGGDSSAAIFDARGGLVAQPERVALTHLTSLRPALIEIMKDFPPQTMRDGDIYLSNDPYRGGIHSNDIGVFRPVIHEGEVVFFTGALVHVADIGGVSAGGLPANATDMFHEGLVLPPLKFYDAGEPNQTLITVLTANSRTPDKVMGDLRALMGGVNVGAQRLQALIKRYGAANLMRISDDLMDYAEQRTRHEIQQLRPGVYEGSFAIDDDGVETRPGGFVVRAKVTIRDSTFEVDFTGTDRQASGAINSSVSQTMSGVVFALRSLIDPTIPLNEGCFRPLKVTLPEGTLVNPKPPGAVNARMATVGAVIDSILEATSTAYPERAVAASCNVHVFTASGLGPTSQRWIFLDTLFGGGGARNGKDGVDTGGGPLIIGWGGGAGRSVESYEMEYPVRIKRLARWEDSGGAGKWRGGSGMVKELEFLGADTLTVRIADRSTFPPRGIQGGLDGRGGSWVMNEGRPDEVVLAGKTTNHPLKPGDVLTAYASGGGGVGNPWERDPDRVLQDVLEHKTSLTEARERYGVAIDPESMTVDAADTQRLRARLSARKDVAA